MFAEKNVANNVYTVKFKGTITKWPVPKLITARNTQNNKTWQTLRTNGGYVYVLFILKIDFIKNYSDSLGTVNDFHLGFSSFPL